MIEPAKKTYGVLLPLPAAAEVLGVSINTLRQWIQLGRIESHKLFGLRRISEDEILRVIEESRQPATGRKRPRAESVTAPTRGRGSR